jgi:NAD(P)-dependent dehydrogenase (short-subunit alcohol dehydrogenase family)
VVLVTGAAGGIGAAIGDRFRGVGATVVGADLPGAGADLALDVTDLGATRAAVATVVAAHDRLDVAIACAGIAVGGPADALDDGAWGRAIDVDLVGAVHTLRAAYEVMLPRGRGHLVAIASLAGLLPSPLLVPYATAKGGLVSFATSLRPEAARHGIGVSVVCPGPVETRLLDDGGAHGIVAGTVDPRRYLTSAAGRPLPPRAIADVVLRCVERDVALRAPGRARLLHLLARVAPRTTERVVALAMRRELART